MAKILHKIYHHEGHKKSKPSPSFPQPVDLLSTAHFHEVNGFYLKSATESPSVLEITPTLGMGDISVSISRWRMETSVILPSSSGRSHSWTKQINSISLVNQLKAGRKEVKSEVIKFGHRHRSRGSSLLGGGRGSSGSNKDNLVSVYFPQSSEPLGWIKWDNDYPLKTSIDDGLVITDSMSNSSFHTVPLEWTADLNNSSVEMVVGMRICNSEGLPVAALQAKRGMKQRRTGQVNWTDWKVHFTPIISSSLSSSAKAVILVACVVWVLNYQERTARLSQRQASMD